MLLNMKRFWIIITFLQVLIFALVSCSKQTNSTSTNNIYELKLGNKTIFAEIAVSEHQKATGLMFRKSMPENNAMIFVFDTPKKMSFWMKNTEIPLDIAFLTKDGEITEIKKMYPHNLNPVKSARSDILYCIETNANWFEKNNVNVGEKLDMQTFNKILKIRKAVK